MAHVDRLLVEAVELHSRDAGMSELPTVQHVHLVQVAAVGARGEPERNVEPAPAVDHRRERSVEGLDGSVVVAQGEADDAEGGQRRARRLGIPPEALLDRP